MRAKQIMEISKIIPVMRVESIEEGLHTAEALLKGGIAIFEITLRTPVALDTISAIRKAFPEAKTGAGTVLNAKQFAEVENAGAHFAISPGLTLSLAHYRRSIPLLPGAATASEIMMGLEHGFDAFKLFPANVVGGVEALKAFIKPFEEVVFCPTAGVNADNVTEYLALKNVLCVGGSWIMPTELIKAKKFSEITRLTEEALADIKL